VTRFPKDVGHSRVAYIVLLTPLAGLNARLVLRMMEATTGLEPV
jgi:hypothetical protein